MDPVRGDRRLVLGEMALEEDPGVDRRMEALHPTLEELGEAGERFDVHDRQPGLDEARRGPSGRHELDPELVEPPPHFDEPRLLVHREERPADPHFRLRSGRGRRVDDDHGRMSSGPVIRAYASW